LPKVFGSSLSTAGAMAAPIRSARGMIWTIMRQTSRR
jgi:hypothetical protein